MSSKRFIIPALTAVLLAALFLPFYFLHQSRNETATGLAEKAKRPPLVRIMKVHSETKETELVLPSFLDAINITPILARTNGYLVDWVVDIGDKVKAGDLLASIDTPDVDQEVIQAEGDLGAAIAKENIARITVDRGLKLYQHNPEAIAKEEVDQMIANHNGALADIESAKGRVGRYKYLQGFKNLYAPFDGTVIERDIDIGSLITAGSDSSIQQMFQIAKSDVLRAFVNVPQNYFHLIQNGLEAEITIPQFPKQIFIGRIDRNAGALDPVARTLLTQVNIDNKKGELLPGLYAQVKFKFKPEQKSFIVPIEAIVIRSGPPYVAMVDSRNIVHFHEIKIGRDYGDKIEIIQGLSEGDELISHVSDRIKDGIEIRRAPSPRTK